MSPPIESETASETPSLKPMEISLPLPKVPHTTLHLHLTFLATSTLLFLTTTSMGDSGGTAKPMGSFVYALPDRTNPKNTMSTPLYTSPSSLDYATRTSRILARKTGLPVYVGCSVDLAGTMAEEEMESLTKVIEVVMQKWKEVKG